MGYIHKLNLDNHQELHLLFDNTTKIMKRIKANAVAQPIDIPIISPEDSEFPIINNQFNLCYR